MRNLHISYSTFTKFPPERANGVGGIASEFRTFEMEPEGGSAPPPPLSKSGVLLLDDSG